jgi:hypothetical protein
MTPCRWCGEPAVTTIQLESTSYRKQWVSGKQVNVVAQGEIRVDVCAKHQHVRDREAGKTIPRGPHKTTAKDVEQDPLFDPGSGAGNAIYGDEQ